MTGIELFLLIIAYHVGGFIVIGPMTDFAGAIGKASGVEFFNPCFIYDKVKVNAFGAIILALVYNALMPIPAVCYWFYKLCTFGRKDDV